MSVKVKQVWILRMRRSFTEQVAARAFIRWMDRVHSLFTVRDRLKSNLESKISAFETLIFKRERERATIIPLEGGVHLIRNSLVERSVARSSSLRLPSSFREFQYGGGRGIFFFLTLGNFFLFNAVASIASIVTRTRTWPCPSKRKRVSNTASHDERSNYFNARGTTRDTFYPRP